MSRALTAAYVNAIASGHLRFVVLVEMYFDSGTSRYVLAPYNFVYGGNTYLGISKIAAIEPIREVAELEAVGMTYQIVANAAYIALALSENIQGRSVIMRLALLDSNYQIMADPVVCFKGRLDTMNFRYGSQAIIRVTAESRFAAWDTARVRRYNSPDQQASYPTDTFFDSVPQMVAKELGWGIPGSDSAGIARSMAVQAAMDFQRAAVSVGE
jgi:hypothetical protein